MRWAMLAVAATLSLAGCVSMPDSGPPGQVTASQTGTGQNQDFIAPLPAPPQPGMSPSEIVWGFLIASASYSTYPQIAQAYLTPAEAKSWNPGGSATVFGSVTVNPGAISSVGRHSAEQACVTVGGPLQATLNRSGQLFAVAQDGQPQLPSQACAGFTASAGSSYEQFTLVKSDDGQWRIDKLPPTLLMQQPDFQRVYQAQDVYFYSDKTFGKLVPDTVFVPLGTTVTQLLTTLVNALIPHPTATTWLTDAVVNSIPTGTVLKGVTVAGTTATVNLGGAIGAITTSKSLSAVSAQLVYTLSGSLAGQANIQAVKLEINGNVWPNGQDQVQTESDYKSRDPYPSLPASFTYVDGGAAQSRCGSVQVSVSPVVPVFGSSGLQVASCAASVVTPTAAPSGSARPEHSAVSRPAAKLSMVAVSPGGDYMAGVSAGDSTVTIWPVGKRPAGSGQTAGTQPASVLTWTGAGITSISWDEQHNLWLTAADGTVWMMSVMTGKTVQVDGPTSALTGVTALSVAPDGVRVAALVNNQLELAAINRGSVSGRTTQGGGPVSAPPRIGTPIQLGPSVTGAVALAWYDADDLMVVIKTADASQLEEVPVSGRAASPPTTLPLGAGVYADSIAAASGANMLVVGLSNGHLEVSAGLNGTWQDLGPGSAPSYGWPSTLRLPQTGSP
jgi:hypothetical protein